MITNLEYFEEEIGNFTVYGKAEKIDNGKKWLCMNLKCKEDNSEKIEIMPFDVKIIINENEFKYWTTIQSNSIGKKYKIFEHGVCSATIDMVADACLFHIENIDYKFFDAENYENNYNENGYHY